MLSSILGFNECSCISILTLSRSPVFFGPLSFFLSFFVFFSPLALCRLRRATAVAAAAVGLKRLLVVDFSDRARKAFKTTYVFVVLARFFGTHATGRVTFAARGFVLSGGYLLKQSL